MSWHFERTGDSGNDGIKGRKLMLPNADDRPAFFAKRPGNRSITSPISGELLSPVGPVSFWLFAMLRAPVPEAAVNKEGYTLAAKDKVWLARNRLMSPPASDSRLTQYGCQLELGVLVAS
jgi:hypothetical protein